MQATVYRFDPDNGSGSVLTDDGRVLAFSLEALTWSGLRHLRPGQRLTVELSSDAVDSSAGPATSASPIDEQPHITQLTLGTIGATLRAGRAALDGGQVEGQPRS